MHTQTPTSTLFPYTTLFRSLRLQTARGASPVTVRSAPSPEVTVPFCLVPSPEFSQAPWYSLPDHLCRFRSEEHTSELQSRGHLVCRLLLEKKDISIGRRILT